MSELPYDHDLLGRKILPDALVLVVAAERLPGAVRHVVQVFEPVGLSVGRDGVVAVRGEIRVRRGLKPGSACRRIAPISICQAWAQVEHAPRRVRCGGAQGGAQKCGKDGPK